MGFFCLQDKTWINMSKLTIFLISSEVFVLITYALSFYRSQNVLGWSEFFVPDQKFIYILWQSQTFSAWQKDDLHSVKLVFVPAQKFLKRHKTFWDLKKRTRRYCLICILCLQGIKKGSASIFADDALTLMMTPKRPKIY